tara:strand:- start:789 stop:1091 length:303 start_codon:yes stop_codon:yes gene_type:complete
LFYIDYIIYTRFLSESGGVSIYKVVYESESESTSGVLFLINIGDSGISLEDFLFGDFGDLLGCTTDIDSLHPIYKNKKNIFILLFISSTATVLSTSYFSI